MVPRAYGEAGMTSRQPGLAASAARDLVDSYVQVVVVDDDQAALSELEEFLRDIGYRCRAFARPDEAFEFLRRRETPVVLLTDVRMPGFDGLSLARMIRERSDQCPPVEIILFSGYGGFDEAVQAMHYGIVDFLLKPIDLRQLQQTLATAVERIRQRLASVDRDQQIQGWLAEMVEKAQRILTPEPDRPLPRFTYPEPREGESEQTGSQGDRLALVKLIQTNRRVRDRHFPLCESGDSMWQILLFVFEQELLDRSVSVTAACHATGLPQTTALRKIDELVQEGLLERRAAEDDRRRINLHCTDECRQAMGRYLETTFGQMVAARNLLS